MINKEIILNADGSIKKDFSDRNIPQNSNNQVSVNVLIPSACFTGLQNYAVILGVARKLNGENSYTTLNTLIMTASKSITIDGVLYIKYSAILSYSYTNKIGILQLSPYIQTTATTQVDDESVEVISIQQAFTNSNLNVIKSVLPQYDASLEEATTATTLASQIALKKIYTFVDTDSASLGQHYYELATGYDPNATQFEGCLVISVYDGETRQYMPYLNDGVELLEITSDGKFYRISGVDYENPTYTYTRLQLSYSKGEIDTKETNLQNQINALNTNKVDKTQKVNGHALSGDIDITKGDVDLGNVANYGVENATPSASGDQLYITSKAVYDALQLIYGILANMPTEQEFNAVKGRISDIETLIGDSDGDDDNVINTLKEVIATLSGLGEDANILSMINAKVNQTDFNTLNNQINGTGGIKDKVDILSERNNAYTEIKNSLGTIDILTTDWVANTGDNKYPYKWELTNGYLEGAVNCIVVYSKDSDTSMLSATAGIDEVNGKLVIYASELPSETISIEKIAVFNDLNAYITYSNELVQQVLQNAIAISDINNTKLPNYIQKSATNGLVKNDGTIDETAYAPRVFNYRDGYTKTTLTQEGVAVGGRYETNSNGTQKVYDFRLNFLGFSVRLKETTNNVETIHELTFDANGDLKIDGNAVGGGKQLYQHNISIVKASTYFVLATIINENNSQMSVGDLEQYLANKGLTSINHCLSCTGADMTQARPYFGVYSNESGNSLYAVIITSSFQQLNLSGITFTDTVTPV